MLAPNTLLQDRYLVMRLLGQGGMGAVYQATDRKFGNAVALKETFYNDIQLQKAFSQEARLLNRLRHAALPVVMDYFAIGDRQFLVMQYIPGMDLEQLLAERRERGQGVFMTSQVLRWADQLLDALEYLHAQKPPIIHRDIKPQNLKLTPRGEVILLDFGLAKGITTQDSQVSQSIRGYTPNYASLEQIRGTGTDARSDLYSIGATLYHLLTGAMPQDAMTRIAAMLMGQPDPLPPINEMNLEVPIAVASVIEKAMSPHPDQRFASAAILRQALRNASRNVPIASFHRTPTLTDEPMRASMAAAAAVAFERLPQPVIYSPPQAVTEKAAPVLDADHVIILIDEGNQESVRSRPRSQPENSKRRSQPENSKRRSQPLSSKRPVASRQFNAESRRSKPIVLSPQRTRIAIAGAIVMGLILVTTGIFLFRSRDWKSRIISGATDPARTIQTNFNVSLANPIRVEALRYHLEINSSKNQPARATGLSPLEAGSKFKFHFKPRVTGYLYLIALGKDGTLQTFLTDQPLIGTGVITNRVEAGRDFQFPDDGQWFMIPPDSDKTPFIVIFSPIQLKTPGFLSAPAGRNLSEIESQELVELRKSLVTFTPELVATLDNNQPDVAVQVSSERPPSQPLIFEISIDKRK
ncbi:MAG: serine/threonine-protein kinase [Acidobacteria bacterium]|nr:serine/threonine-protein kinase [Acidobacteriota bacterium]